MYLPTNKGPILLKAMQCRIIRFSEEMEPILIGGEHIARAVVEGISEDGVEQFFHADGTISLEVEQDVGC